MATGSAQHLPKSRY